MALRSPDDARVAVRSFPRRFSELLAAAEGDPDIPDDVVAAVAEAEAAATSALSDASVALGGVAAGVLGAAADELTAVIDRRHGEQWKEALPDGRMALEVLDRAVSEAADHLRAAERRVEAARDERD